MFASVCRRPGWRPCLRVPIRCASSSSATKLHGTRQEAGTLVPARIAEVRHLAPLIKYFALHVPNTFTFRAGQWSDVYVFHDGNQANVAPANYMVGGFSMISSPQTARSGRVEFCIKRTNHPVTRHMHGLSCGDSVLIDGGHGDFYFSAERFPNVKAISLLCGGIGITPLLSIVRHVAELGDKMADVQVTLLHSARRPEELLFKSEIEQIVRTHPNIRVVWTITDASAFQEYEAQSIAASSGQRTPADSVDSRSGSDVGLDSLRTNREAVVPGRISFDLLNSLHLGSEGVHFVCGPPEMVKNLVRSLHSLGVADEQIQYEKWY
eukprot:TRINITY_DN32392_c0_g1_i1.p1 TRINITY_DN32392_c0_g1~~TRINITY_DN32392_c0_g1_i1.p1  ORF type:complete len:323 (-),score=56.13 TRINITY_DN32392_c0_g1_i1:67-1035(-)